VRIALATITLVVLTACASSGGNKPAEPSPLPTLERQTIDARTVWRRDTGAGAGGDLVSGFRIGLDGRRLYTAHRDGRIVATDLESGKRQWSVDTGLRLVSGPTVGEGTLLAGSRDGEVIALKAEDGSELWRSEISSEVLAAPAIGNGTAVVRTLDGSIAALELDTGERRWTVQRNVPTLTLRGASMPVVIDDMALAGLDSGKLIALDLENGDVRWEQVVAAPSGRSELERIVDIDASLLVVDDEVYVVSAGGQLASLSLNSGRVRWKRSIGSRTGMSFARGEIFFTDMDSHVGAIGRINGADSWRQKALAHRGLTRPVMHRGYVTVADFEGHVHWMVPEDGTLVARAQPLGDPVRAEPLVVGERLYLLSVKGDIAAVEVEFPETEESE